MHIKHYAHYAQDYYPRGNRDTGLCCANTDTCEKTIVYVTCTVYLKIINIDETLNVV